MCLFVEIRRPGDVLAKGEHQGLEWVVAANRDLGFRCGYVRIPLGHPWHGEGYSSHAIESIQVHGRITFAEPDVPCEKDGDDNAWWIGFDCGHATDAPDLTIASKDAVEWLARHQQCFQMWSPVVRTQEYVESECRRLCEQAREADPLPGAATNQTAA